MSIKTQNGIKQSHFLLHPVCVFRRAAFLSDLIRLSLIILPSTCAFVYFNIVL